jgi:hypothetical protein
MYAPSRSTSTWRRGRGCAERRMQRTLWPLRPAGRSGPGMVFYKANCNGDNPPLQLAAAECLFAVCVFVRSIVAEVYAERDRTRNDFTDGFQMCHDMAVRPIVRTRIPISST